MRKLRAAAGILLGSGAIVAAGILPASASTVTYGDPYHSTAAATPDLFGSCSPGEGVSFGFNSYIRRVLINTPSGPLNNIESYEDFRIQCQPRSGSLTTQLQYRSGTPGVWEDQGDAQRFDFPTTHSGFTLSNGPTLCQGRKTSWRLAIFSSGVSEDGTKWGPDTTFDPRLGGSSGTYFNCG